MGNQKQKWTAEEEEALKAGVAKHGAGKWKNILIDSEFAPKLANRSNVDLKDKWRNMGASHGQGCRDNSVTPKAKATASNAAAPKPQNSSTVFSSKEKANENPPHSPQETKNVPKYNAMILEALSSLKDPSGSDIGAIVGFIEQKYEVPQNFRRLLSSKLRKLVLQGKLEKVLQCYKIKDASLGTKTPSPKQKDVRPRPSQQSSLTISDETVEDAARSAAQWIAEAENKAFVMAEALKESERVSQMAEDADAMHTLCKELFERCSRGEYILMD
ncbi:telomere repeat-binding factor 4 isoform X1 [Sesamum indicum]|uniref:MYB transcription factor n=1 Tax=Sesamum indicum TaxID=4182 RepID=A0A6I9STA2_SESIN|nr:telomere repeat-binding factor 4 isoform X1 [Sesamum indicum]